MNAQEAWKHWYDKWLTAKSNGRNPITISSLRTEMYRYRYEAALERRIAALERENAALHAQLGEANRFIWTGML